MFEKWYALDPGSYEFRMYDYSNDTSYTMRSCIAYKEDEVVGIGQDALEYVYHQNKNTKVKYPMEKGNIKSDIYPLLDACLKALNAPRSFYKPCLRIYLTENNSAIQKKWLNQIQHTNIKRVDFVSELDLLSSQDIRVSVHAGHSYTRIIVTMKGKPLFGKTIYFAGRQIDESIQSTVTKLSQCLISTEDARALKEMASKNLANNKNAKLSCFGMNRYQQYQKIEVSSMDIWPCMETVHKQIVLWIKHCFDKMTLEMKEKVLTEGIYVSGGLANCFGLKQIIEYEMKCPVICTNDSSFDMMEKMKGWK